MTTMSSLVVLPIDFKTAKSKVLFGSEIFSLNEFFSLILRTEGPPLGQPNSALVSRQHIYKLGRSFHYPRNKGRGPPTFKALPYNS